MIKILSWKKLLLAVVKIAISICILIWLFNKANRENQFEIIAGREKNWIWLVVSLQLVVLAHFVSFVRWRMLVRALNISFSTLDAVRIGLIGLFFGVFAFGPVGGDSLRIYYAAREAKSKLPEVICSVFLDRAIGLLVMFTFAALGFLFVDFNFDADPDNDQMTRIRYLCTFITVVAGIGWTCAVAFLVSPRLLTSD